jgi:hypothetical protein
MKRMAGPLMGIMALLVLGAMFAFKTWLLPDSYSTSTAGSVGFGAIALGVAMTTGLSFFATQGEGDAGSVARFTGPIVPLFYTLVACALFLLSPVLSANFAKGLHAILLLGALFAMATWTFASVAIASEDAAQQSAGAGRDGMMAALGAAERRMSESTAAGGKQAMGQLKDDINFADRSGSAASAAIESQVISALDTLDMSADDAGLVAAVGAIQTLVAERKAVLKAGR